MADTNKEAFPFYVNNICIASNIHTHTLSSFSSVIFPWSTKIHHRDELCCCCVFCISTRNSYSDIVSYYVLRLEVNPWAITSIAAHTRSKKEEEQAHRRVKKQRKVIDRPSFPFFLSCIELLILVVTDVVFSFLYTVHIPWTFCCQSNATMCGFCFLFCVCALPRQYKLLWWWTH